MAIANTEARVNELEIENQRLRVMLTQFAGLVLGCRDGIELCSPAESVSQGDYSLLTSAGSIVKTATCPDESETGADCDWPDTFLWHEFRDSALNCMERLNQLSRHAIAMGFVANTCPTRDDVRKAARTLAQFPIVLTPETPLALVEANLTQIAALLQWPIEDFFPVRLEAVRKALEGSHRLPTRTFAETVLKELLEFAAVWSRYDAAA